MHVLHVPNCVLVNAERSPSKALLLSPWSHYLADCSIECREISGSVYRYCRSALFGPEHEMPCDKTRTPRECTLLSDMLDCSLPEGSLLRGLEIFECLETSFNQARDNLRTLVEVECLVG